MPSNDENNNMTRNRLQNCNDRLVGRKKIDLLGVMAVLTQVSDSIQSLADQPDEHQILLSQFTVQEHVSVDTDRSNHPRQASADGVIDIH
jgi:hypothetical protein